MLRRTWELERRERSAEAIARRSAKRKASLAAMVAAKVARCSAVAVARSSGAASSAVAVACPSAADDVLLGGGRKAGAFGDPSAVAVSSSSSCGAMPKHNPHRAAAVPASSDRKRSRLMPSLELFVVAGMFPGDMHRLPWNAMFVSIG